MLYTLFYACEKVYNIPCEVLSQQNTIFLAWRSTADVYIYIPQGVSISNLWKRDICWQTDQSAEITYFFVGAPHCRVKNLKSQDLPPDLEEEPPELDQNIVGKAVCCIVVPCCCVTILFYW